MRPYKLKINETVGMKRMALLTPYNGWAMTVQAVLYTGDAPEQKLHLYDADGDEFMYPIPGQIDEKIVNPTLPTTVKLPLTYYDESSEGNHKLIVFGYVEKPDNTLTDKKDATGTDSEG